MGNFGFGFGFGQIPTVGRSLLEAREGKAWDPILQDLFINTQSLLGLMIEFEFYLKPLQLLLKYRIRYFDFLPTSHSDEDILILTQFNQRQSFYYKKFQTFLSNAKGLKITGRLGFKSIFYDLFFITPLF